MPWKRMHPLLWLLLAPPALCGLSLYLRPDTWRPQSQTALHAYTVYAYRQWQSTGVKLVAGDRFTIRASGQWSYSPYVEPHGPEGGEWAPDWYPLTGNRHRALGGALLGRVGESSAPFIVGRRYTGYAEQPGALYLRINDDLLGDNVGQLQLEIRVVHPAAAP